MHQVVLRRCRVTIATLADYRDLVSDTFSSPEDIAVALGRAEQIVVRRTERHWVLGAYTEKLRLYPDGLVYPSDTPLVSVSDPAGATINGNAIGSGSWTWPTVNLEPDFFSGNPVPLVSTTYVGGYAPGLFPEELVAVQCEIALFKLNPPSMIGVPVGAQQIKTSTKGQGFAGVRMGGASALPPSIRATLRELQVRRL